MKALKSLALGAALLAVQTPVAPALSVEAVQTISGPAYTIDGDTIVVGTVHVRLNGVDAPEVAHPRHPLTTIVDLRAETRCTGSSATKSCAANSTASGPMTASSAFASCPMDGT